MSQVDPETLDGEWHRVLTEGDSSVRRMRHVFRLLPTNPRCKTCYAPFKGLGGFLMRLIGRPQSSKNPLYCEPCVFHEPGGAEVEVSMLFADVRGSTEIAEDMAPAAYRRLIERFYETATDVLVHADALVNRLMGDEVIGLFAPGFAGVDHARRAVQAAQELRRRTGHSDANGPWLPIGIGVHTGLAFVGVVKGGPEGLYDFTMLGDNVNVTARLASAAAAGEVLVSEAAYAAAGLESEAPERRQLQLKGKSDSVGVRVVETAVPRRARVKA